MKQTKATPTACIYAEIHGSTCAVKEAMNGIFDRFNDAFNREFNDEDIFLPAVAPDIELCVIREDEATDCLPCYAEADTVEEVHALGLLVCYHPAQVISMSSTSAAKKRTWGKRGLPPMMSNLRIDHEFQSKIPPRSLGRSKPTF